MGGQAVKYPIGTRCHVTTGNHYDLPVGREVVVISQLEHREGWVVVAWPSHDPNSISCASGSIEEAKLRSLAEAEESKQKILDRLDPDAPRAFSFTSPSEHIFVSMTRFADDEAHVVHGELGDLVQLLTELREGLD